MDAAAAAKPHVLVFPWPLQGHINCMLHLAAALLDAGVHVTFLHTEHNLRRLSRACLPPRLRLLSVPDGLPDDHPRSVRSLMELLESMSTTGSAAYRSMLLSLRSTDPCAAACGGAPPVTCVIADNIMQFAVDVAEELGIPALAFRTASACSYLAYLSMPRLVERHEAPFPADGPVLGVPGMEGFLRRRDLPRLNSTDRLEDGVFDPMLLSHAEGIANNRTARALIFNTAASMEGPALSHIAPHMGRDIFAIGPLHALATRSRGRATSAGAEEEKAEHARTTASLWREDDGCIAWLDGQEDRSVVYVSLGSLSVISHEQFTEFLSGLVASGYAFLWVLRPDMIQNTACSAVVQEAVNAAAAAGGNGKQARMRIVDWAPQLGVLRHRAVGCFLTHAGWNSTLEGAIEGVPMVCWPFFADQLINSRFVGAVWRTGLDMKDVCDRATVERTVREAMVSGALRERAQAMAQQLRLDVAEGGSSSSELERLVGFIRELSTMPCRSGPVEMNEEH